MIRTALLCLSLVLAPLAAAAQAVLPFGGFKHDASLPVEIEADSLTVNQAEGNAIFDGNVIVGQGTLRLAADSITVYYTPGGQATGEVSQMEARGNVTLTNGAEAAEAERASYDVGEGRIAMAGNVLLTQGANALSGQSLDIDLNTGTARMQGRVQSILQPRSQ